MVEGEFDHGFQVFGFVAGVVIFAVFYFAAVDRISGFDQPIDRVYKPDFAVARFQILDDGKYLGRQDVGAMSCQV